MCTRNVLFVWIAFGLCLVAGSATAQTAATGKPNTDAQCQKDLAKFDQAIAFARQAQGQEAASKLREKLLPAQVESELLAREGYCGLARHLREKRLLD